MRTGIVVVIAGVTLCGWGCRGRVAEKESHRQPDETLSRKAGRVAYEASQQAGKIAKKAGNEIKKDAKEMREGWKDAARESKHQGH